jgi:hypothetical protein
MFEWFFSPYSSLLVGVEFLLSNPAACSAVEMLRGVTVLLCVAAGARIGAHWVADRRLRRRPVYDRNEFSGLYDLYREAGARVGMTPAAAAPAGGRGPAGIHHRVLPAGPLPGADPDPLAGGGRASRGAGARARPRSRRDNLRAWLGSLLPIGAVVVLLQATALYVMFFRVDLRFGFTHAGLLVAAVLAILWPSGPSPGRGWYSGASSPAMTAWWRRCRTRSWSPLRW